MPKDARAERELVAVYIVTYRRHTMLRRSIASVLAQTHADLKLWVVNDDPADAAVAEIVASFEDSRAELYQPVRKRGPAANFNLVYREQGADFAALLEDDNWWQPTFLESQLAALRAYPEAPIVVGNERIWRECTDGGWSDTGRTIWPFRDIVEKAPSVEDICGSATICNSSVLVRVDRDHDLLTPETIPADVTEHFRDRLLPGKVLLNGEALVNYAETLQTVRGNGSLWGQYQVLLIGSVFVAAQGTTQRARIAARLWRSAGPATSPRAVTLVMTGLKIREARSLVYGAPIMALLRAAIFLIKQPQRLGAIMGGEKARCSEMQFLADAPLTNAIIGSFT
jgi:hypothetical protein